MENVHGILVPGGFGERGARGKIEAASFARERGVPYFGICFGMQMAVVEAARNLADIPDAGSTEFGRVRRSGRRPDDRMDARQPHRTAAGRAATSAAPCASAPTSACSSRTAGHARSSRRTRITERHRHRYEVNNDYIGTLERRGLMFSGMSPDGLLPEIVELPDHPWFIGVQFHPELRSRPFEPHPLFASFIRAAVDQSRLV